VAAVALTVLLAVLATQQYRWLGAVSAAERERMRSSLQTRATDLAREFDGELTRIYTAFRADTAGLDADPAAAIASAYARWHSTSANNDLVRAIYLVEGGDAAAAPKRFDFTSHALEATDWPPELRQLLPGQRPLRLPDGGLPSANLPSPLFLVDAVNAKIPALVIAVPRITRSIVNGQVTVVTDPAAIARSIVVVLDADRLVRDLVAPLAAKQFGDAATSDYAVTVVRRDDPESIVYKTGPAVVDAAAADVVVSMFDLRMDELARLAEGHDNVLPTLKTSERVAITIVRRGGGEDGKHVLAAGTSPLGAWQLRVRYRSGSLDSIVAASRRRNVAVGLGVLGLLAASVALVIVSAQRQQRLARQQMEFVAAVSHELRTPLAVICSAGENLADGVVAEADQVKRYGSVIQNEGRRLHGMVERVMTFAGISSGAPIRVRRDVDVSRLVADAVTGAVSAATDRQVTVSQEVASDVPPIVGDADALRSAFQNVIDNAIKYSHDGGTVQVDVDFAAPIRPGISGRVRLRVRDAGIGIDSADLSRVFEPFFRGRAALEAQVRGSGIGLSVVKHVIDAHAGDVRVDSAPRRGTTVTLTIPLLHLHDRPASAATRESRLGRRSNPDRGPMNPGNGAEAPARAGRDQ
jgi:signal transduction histidine kinase